jgi:hypothetical protein
MVKRPGDKTQEPPGGRAAERLRMFEDARGLATPPAAGKSDKAKRKDKKSVDQRAKGGTGDEGKKRPKD